VQIRNFKSAPRVYRSAPHIRPAGLHQYSCRSAVFTAAPTCPAYKNHPRVSKYIAHIHADPQFQICPACLDQPCRSAPQASTYVSILRQISSFYSSPTELTLLTYYRSAPHFHLHNRSAPQIRPTPPIHLTRLYMAKACAYLCQHCLHC